MTRAGATPIPPPRRDAEIIADADAVVAGGDPGGLAAPRGGPAGCPKAVTGRVFVDCTGVRISVDDLRGTLEEHGAVSG
jgi:hypothetical protein